MQQRRPRVTRNCIITAMVVLWLSSTSVGYRAVIGSLETVYAHYGDPDQLPQAEAIVVLGGATKSPVLPRPRPEVSEAGDRLLHAAALYQAGKAPRLILSGGRVVWGQTDPPALSEAQDMALLLQSLMQIPPEAIIQEPRSLNTYQNAINVQGILQREGIGKILLVTSAFHMPRALAIFHKLGINAIPAPTDFYVIKRDQKSRNLQNLLFDLLPDVGNLEKTSKGMKEYMGIVVYWLKGWL
jgi:uncharacterized SAM-binding protein YcdF (DUF218 family)